FAGSGILDPGMATFHYRAAARSAARAGELGTPPPDPAVLEARARCGLGELEQAAACLASLDASQRGRSAVRVVRAEIAFLRRDFAAVREEAASLARAGVELPDWLRALHEPTEAAP
ncbi:MAG: hypothetical protein ACE5JG_13600, partial [Planctomycetota bacterium]